MGGPIEYAITLNGEHKPRVVLRCIGKVLRYERAPSRTSREAFHVAATMERYEFIRSEK